MSENYKALKKITGCTRSDIARNEGLSRQRIHQITEHPYHKNVKRFNEMMLRYIDQYKYEYRREYEAKINALDELYGKVSNFDPSESA